MKIYSLLHAAFESSAYFQTWANAQQHSLIEIHRYAGQALPDKKDVDVLLIMGGPQDAGRYQDYPYLAEEVNFIKQIMAEEKPILGVCLGAQLISESLGAPTLTSPHKEIGYFPITLTDAGRQDTRLQALPNSLSVCHWHNDMPGLPTGSHVLASSPGCPHQIIRYNKNTYGLQCHLELTRENLEKLIAHCPKDLSPGPYIQQAKDMLNENHETSNAYLGRFLAAFLT